MSEHNLILEFYKPTYNLDFDYDGDGGLDLHFTNIKGEFFMTMNDSYNSVYIKDEDCEFSKGEMFATVDLGDLVERIINGEFRQTNGKAISDWGKRFIGDGEEKIEFNSKNYADGSLFWDSFFKEMPKDEIKDFMTFCEDYLDLPNIEVDTVSDKYDFENGKVELKSNGKWGITINDDYTIISVDEFTCDSEDAFVAYDVASSESDEDDFYESKKSVHKSLKEGINDKLIATSSDGETTLYLSDERQANHGKDPHYEFKLGENGYFTRYIRCDDIRCENVVLNWIKEFDLDISKSEISKIIKLHESKKSVKRSLKEKMDSKSEEIYYLLYRLFELNLIQTNDYDEDRFDEITDYIEKNGVDKSYKNEAYKLAIRYINRDFSNGKEYKELIKKFLDLFDLQVNVHSVEWNVISESKKSARKSLKEEKVTDSLFQNIVFSMIKKFKLKKEYDVERPSWSVFNFRHKNKDAQFAITFDERGHGDFLYGEVLAFGDEKDDIFKYKTDEVKVDSYNIEKECSNIIADCLAFIDANKKITIFESEKSTKKSLKEYLVKGLDVDFVVDHLLSLEDLDNIDLINELGDLWELYKKSWNKFNKSLSDFWKVMKDIEKLDSFDKTCEEIIDAWYDDIEKIFYSDDNLENLKLTYGFEGNDVF